MENGNTPQRRNMSPPAHGSRSVSTSVGCGFMSEENCEAIRFFRRPSACCGESHEPLLDLGCGVGLLPFYLRERNFAPRIIGFDRDHRKILRANAVVRQNGYRDLEFIERDVTETIAERGNIVLFDLLHYLSPNEQTLLLERLVPQIAPGGLLLIRDCPREGNVRFWLTYLAERFAQITSWNLRTPLHFPTREKISAPFLPNEFTSSFKPLWGRTPFNNHLFIFRRRAVVPASAGRNDNLHSLG